MLYAEAYCPFGTYFLKESIFGTYSIFLPRVLLAYISLTRAFLAHTQQDSPECCLLAPHLPGDFISQRERDGRGSPYSFLPTQQKTFCLALILLSISSSSSVDL